MNNTAIVFQSMPLPNDVRKIPSGCDNGDAFETAQIDEIAITRDRAIGIPGAGGVEKFVVVRISTDMNKASRSYHGAIAHKDDDGSFSGFGGNVAVEFFAGNYAEQFVPRGRRENQRSLAGEKIQQSAGNRLRGEDATDNRVCIDDNTLTGWHRSCA